MVIRMTYDRFKTEDELLRSVSSSLGYNVYPKVSAIAGNRINPDIDILQISKVSEHESRLVSHELKLTQFDKRSKGLGWSTFYRGIGQSLMYLRNGIHRAVLVLGFHESIPNDGLIEHFHKFLWNKRDLLSGMLGNHLSVATCLYKRGSPSPVVEAKGDFYSSDEETRFSSQSLLHKKFTFYRRTRMIMVG